MDGNANFNLTLPPLPSFGFTSVTIEEDEEEEEEEGEEDHKQQRTSREHGEDRPAPHIWTWTTRLSSPSKIFRRIMKT